MITQSQGTKIRIDKWLWHARFFKTRSLAAKTCRSGKVRLNGAHISKASTLVQSDDVLTFIKSERLWVVRLVDCGVRRGPAPEAQALYEDLTPPDANSKKGGVSGNVPSRDRGSGRPTKAERRAINKLMDRD